MIREVEPPKPSTRLSTLGVRDRRTPRGSEHVDVPTLRRQLRGELDWITMKALEKDRDASLRIARGARSRSGAASAQRAGARRPAECRLSRAQVRATPPRRRRHRGRRGVALGGFAVAMGVQARRISREAEAKRQVSSFLAELFKVSNPSEARGGNITARELLDRGVVKIRGNLHGDPRVRAELMATMGTVYLGLGLYDQAEPSLKRR